MTDQPALTTAQDALAAGIEAHRSGDLDGAEAAYRRLLALHPNHPDALHLLGQIARARGQLDAGLALARQASRVHPAPSYFATVGAILAEQGHSEDALGAFDQGLALKPGDPAILYNKANALRRLGRLDEAVTLYRSVLAQRPGLAEAHYNLGNALYDQAQYAQSLTAFQDAERIDGRDADTLANIGNALVALARHDDALQYYRRALNFAADNPAGLLGLGRVMIHFRNNEEAIAALRRLIGRDPAHIEARYMLIWALESLDRLDDAKAELQQIDARVAHDGAKIRAAVQCPSFYQDVAQIARARARIDTELDALLAAPLHIDDPVKQVVATTFRLAYHGQDDLPLQLKYAALLRHACPELQWTAPHCALPLPGGGRKLRIGFISVFFRTHTIMRLNAGVMSKLDRSRFDTTIIHAQIQDGAGAATDADGQRSVTLPVNLEAARRMIAELELDVLYYTDIGMDQFTHALAFARLAPVQCVSWGHPDTTGIATIDYFLSPREAEPADAAGFYSETLIGLRHLPTYYEPPPMAPPGVRTKLDFAAGRPLYLCPQSIIKLHPDFDAALAGILSADRGAQIGLLSPNRDVLEQRLMARLRRKIGPDMERIRFIPFLPREEFVRLMEESEIMLDPFHFGGGNTTMEALSVGVPIVTWPGRFMRARIALACYKMMAIEGLVAKNLDDYVALAVGIANDRPRQQALRAQILARSGAVIRNSGAVREIEAFLEAALAAAADGRKLDRWPAVDKDGAGHV